MLKIFFRNTAVLCVALSLSILPAELLAAGSKSSKRVHASYKLSKKGSVLKTKYRASGRGGLQKAKVRLRNQRIWQAQRAEMLGENYDGSSYLQLASSKALVINQKTGEVIYAKNTNTASPIASITKLMTAMVMLDAGLSLDDTLYVSQEDVDYLKGSSSRLPVGTSLTRGDMLQLALMASENRAASAMARNYPGGKDAFIKAMNTKAQAIGMVNTHFADPTGLDSGNVSTAEDLAKMVQAAYQYPEIRMSTTSPSHEVYMQGRTYPVNFNNTNGLVRAGEWEIGLSKTGYISEAGRCLVMQAQVAGEPLIMVFLDSNGKLSRIGDANRVRKWVEYNKDYKPTTTGQSEQVAIGNVS
ncbi:MAG TPA: D-alanyl-D-alanine endopeptidase [Methylophilus sp.]|nr:D-alanyl-D-alanine endopeptidase [Methylophilus sp.]HQQ32742.1 D-alanyl-D-alanine endopeptidase [Methylophilus sp.]